MIWVLQIVGLGIDVYMFVGMTVLDLFLLLLITIT